MSEYIDVYMYIVCASLIQILRREQGVVCKGLENFSISILRDSGVVQDFLSSLGV